MPLSPVVAHELRRKAFHVLTLVYLGAYRYFGWPRVLAWMGLWTAAVAAAEFGRLYWPAFNRLALKPFERILREEERAKLSGAYYTSLGALLTMALFGRRPVVVSAALVCLAVGDAAAALAGRILGRHRWPGSPKSVEGSLACLAACVAGCWVAGAGPGAALMAALAVTALELAPLPFNDNLWIPLGAGAVVWLAGA